jgi:hypothetical protein
MNYRGFESSYPLLCAYDELAVQHKKRNEPQAAIELGGPLLGEVKSMKYDNYNFTLALLNLNAAILEGVMRSVLSEIVLAELEAQAQEGRAAARYCHSPVT